MTRRRPPTCPWLISPEAVRDLAAMMLRRLQPEALTPTAAVEMRGVAREHLRAAAVHAQGQQRPRGKRPQLRYRLSHPVQAELVVLTTTPPTLIAVRRPRVTAGARG